MEEQFILDVSKYQGTIDFDLLKTDPRVRGIIEKVTDGNGYVDEKFERNWREAERVGLNCGGYHFAQPDMRARDAEDEAAFFFSRLLSAGYKPRRPLMLALDIEKARQIEKGRPFTDWVISFNTALDELTGVRSGIYTGGPFWDEHDGVPDQATEEKLRQWWLWIAAYVNDPTRYVNMTPWKHHGATFHQFSGDVGPGGAPGLRYPGITENVVDTNRFMLKNVDFDFWMENLVIPGAEPVFYPETNVPNAADFVRTLADDEGDKS